MINETILKLKCVFVPCENNQYKPKFLEGRFLFYLFFTILALKLISVIFLLYIPNNIFFADITKTNLVQMTNQERQSLGLQTLKENQKLDEVANLKAQDMLAKAYFSHQSPEGVTPWYWFKKVGYTYKIAGENLAIGFLDSEEVHDAWMNSPLHKRNIVNPNYSEIGMAVVSGEFQGNKVYLVVQVFGAPKNSIVLAEKQTLKEEKTVTPQKEEKATTSTFVAELGTSTIASAETSTPNTSLSKKEALAFNLTEFASQKYSNLVENLIYLMLFFIVFSLVVAIWFDLFVYKKFKLQHKDLVFKAAGFTLLLLIFLYFDKERILQMIPHAFLIY